jgi:hypothetical protein
VNHFFLLQFLNLRQSIELLERGISPSQGQYLTQIQNESKETSMPSVGFEHAIPAFERVKELLALDRAATVVVCYVIKLAYY